MVKSKIVIGGALSRILRKLVALHFSEKFI